MFVIATDDSSRVVLSMPNSIGTDYINASFVDVSINFLQGYKHVFSLMVVCMWPLPVVGLHEERPLHCQSRYA